MTEEEKYNIFNEQVYQRLGTLIQQQNELRDKIKENEDRIKNIECGLQATYSLLTTIKVYLKIE